MGKDRAGLLYPFSLKLLTIMGWRLRFPNKCRALLCFSPVKPLGLVTYQLPQQWLGSFFFKQASPPSLLDSELVMPHGMSKEIGLLQARRKATGGEGTTIG